MNKDIILFFGGDGRIAQSIVRKYLDNNCIVLAVDRKEKNSDPSFNENPDYHYYSADITDINELKNLYNTVKNEYGYVNHIISGASRVFPSDNNELYNLDLDEIEPSIKLNLVAHIYISNIFLPLLKESNSSNRSITFISSINAIRSLQLPVYSAAKSGIFGLVHSSVKLLGKDKIRINSIVPGTVFSEELGASKDDRRFHDNKILETIPLGNYTSPEDIADAIYSITHITKAVTGQNIVVDSGQTS